MVQFAEVVTAKQMEEFERMLLTHPEMKKKVKKVLSSVLSKGRARLSKEAKAVIDEDPRQAYRAVKRTVYKRILGGSISILAKRRAGNTRVRVEKTRTLVPGQRGGNRRKRSERTEAIDSYFASDRGFILRFLNAGTGERLTKYGRRGSIAPRNWFGTASQRAMEEVAQRFCDLMDKEIEAVLDK